MFRVLSATWFAGFTINARKDQSLSQRTNQPFADLAVSTRYQLTFIMGGPIFRLNNLVCALVLVWWYQRYMKNKCNTSIHQNIFQLFFVLRLNALQKAFLMWSLYWTRSSTRPRCACCIAVRTTYYTPYPCTTLPLVLPYATCYLTPSATLLWCITKNALGRAIYRLPLLHPYPSPLRVSQALISGLYWYHMPTRVL